MKALLCEESGVWRLLASKVFFDSVVRQRGGSLSVEESGVEIRCADSTLGKEALWSGGSSL